MDIESINTIFFFTVPLVSSFSLALIFTWWVRKIAVKLGIFDYPDSPRKIHNIPVPLWGGLALFLAFAANLAVFWRSGWLTGDRISGGQLFGLLAASALLLIGGLLDDKYNISPLRQLIWPLLAVFAVMAFGVQVGFVTDPQGGFFRLDTWSLNISPFENLRVLFFPLAQSITFAWLLGMTYTTKLLDGLDGLATGIVAIGALIIFIVSLSWNEPFSPVSVLSLMLAGVAFGFLVYNMHPASIFLGEAGATLLGFWLGVLAIISGSKIATTLLIMGIPILDVIWVIVRRVFFEKKSLAAADKKHLHFRLLDAGWSQRKVVMFLFFLTALFGSVALWQKTTGKIIALVVLLLVMIVLGTILVRVGHQNKVQDKAVDNG